MKGLKKQDELEAVNSDKSWNGSETVGSVKQFDLDESNCLKSSGQKGSRGGANTGTTRKLTKALRTNKPIEEVEARGTGWLEECEQGEQISTWAGSVCGPVG